MIKMQEYNLENVLFDSFYKILLSRRKNIRNSLIKGQTSEIYA